LLRGIQKAIAGGIKLIQLRAPNGYDPKYRDLAVDAAGLCAGKAQLMIKGPFEWLGDFPSAGWHITSAQLRKYAAAKGRPLPAERWLAASCHNAEELALAEQMGVDFVTLSPVQPTLTHPDAQPLGWEQASTLIEGFSKPVFLLGGVGPAELEKAWAAGHRVWRGFGRSGLRPDFVAESDGLFAGKPAPTDLVVYTNIATRGHLWERACREGVLARD
jgi:8-oxo-dGTP diphosphatase